MKRDYVAITGGASGIGRALVQEWAHRGARVIALDINDERLRELKDESAKSELDIETFRLDITDREAGSTWIKEFSRRGRIATWVNCAGSAGLGEFEKTGSAEFEKVLNLNLLAVVNLSRAVLTHMQGNGFGKIVNIASVAGIVPAPFMSAYCLTKHALVGFTRSMQLEMNVTESPVQFILVCPGFVETEMIRLGQPLGMPDWMRPVLADPRKTAREIVAGVESGKLEIFPTLNGNIMLKMYRLFPKLTSRQARLLLARDWKDLLLNRVRG